MNTNIDTRIERILRNWDAIADHRTGSPGDRRTAEWLTAEAAAAGASAELDCFPFRRRIVGEAWVEIGATRIEGLPCFDGGATAGPIEDVLSTLHSGGGIGVGAFSPAALDADTRLLMQARGTTAYAGLIAVSSGRDVRPGLAVTNAEHYGEPLATPVLQVATEHREFLESAVRAGRRARLQIRFDEQLTEACNVQAVIPGRRGELAPVVIMTPRSSWWTSTAERGGGIAVWLEALRQFARVQPLRTVICTANTGHELGHSGLDAWLERAGALLSTAHVWVHLGANFAARGGQLRLQASSDRLLQLGLEALADAAVLPEQITPVGTRPLGEARNVFDGQGQYVSLLGSNPLFHHPDDRWPHAIDLPRTVALCRALLALVDGLANAPAA